jgi:hypothetical protein
MHPGTEAPVRQSEECRKLLWQIAERAYLEYINLRQQFFRFTPGKLLTADPASFSNERGRRAYHFSCGKLNKAHKGELALLLMLLAGVGPYFVWKSMKWL